MQILRLHVNFSLAETTAAVNIQIAEVTEVATHSVLNHTDSSVLVLYGTTPVVSDPRCLLHDVNIKETVYLLFFYPPNNPSKPSND